MSPRTVFANTEAYQLEVSLSTSILVSRWLRSRSRPVETAWHYRHRARVGDTLARRRRGQPGRVIAIADKAQQRLCRRFRTLTGRQMPAPKVTVAIARELAGFVWAALQPEPAAANN